jgi:nucleolar protein 4
MPDGEAEKDARTVFVRNVAFSVDNAGLEQVFADIGPVRQCFLVTQKGTEGTKHRGIAFVQFAIPEDAQRAVEELNGKEVAGRRLKVCALQDGTSLVHSLGCVVYTTSFIYKRYLQHASSP